VLGRRRYTIARALLRAPCPSSRHLAISSLRHLYRHRAISPSLSTSRHLNKRSTIAHGRSLTVCCMRMFVRPLDARHHNENHAAQPQAPRTACAAADPAPIVSLLLVDKPLVPACVPLRALSRQLAQSHEAANRATHESDAWRIWAGRSRKVARRVEGRPRGDAMRCAALQERAWMGRRKYCVR